jgi:hypothetical protein
MRRLALVGVLLLAVLGVALAQGGKVATVTASAPFKLKGAEVNPAGVPSWPVLAGDAIEAGKAPVTLTFEDGTKVALSPGAKGRVEVQNGKAVFVLTEGEALYDLKGMDSVRLMALDKQVKPSATRGTYCVGCSSKAPGGFWTAKNTALVLAGGAGAGLGLGIAAAQGGAPAPVSPVR